MELSIEAESKETSTGKNIHQQLTPLKEKTKKHNPS